MRKLLDGKNDYAESKYHHKTFKMCQLGEKAHSLIFDFSKLFRG